MKYYLILLIIILLVVTLFHKNMEIFTNYNGSRDISPYINFDLHDKPVANNAPYYIYQWWKYGHDTDKYDNCDQYRCQSKGLNGFNAPGGFNMTNNKYLNPTHNLLLIHDKNALTNDAFYHNMSHFCSTHSHDPRCANYRLPCNQ